MRPNRAARPCSRVLQWTANSTSNLTLRPEGARWHAGCIDAVAARVHDGRAHMKAMALVPVARAWRHFAFWRIHGGHTTPAPQTLMRASR